MHIFLAIGYCVSKNWGGGGGTESVVTDAVCVFLVIDTLVCVPSDALPLYQILKQSDNWLWRYCI